MSDHARLAPSAAPQWGFCSGSVKAQEQFPDRETEQTREGTAAHWVGSTVLESMRADQPLVCSDLIGERAPNGVVIDDKMAEGAEEYVANVAEVCDRFHAWGSLLIEHRVHMPKIHPTDNWGTLDAALYLPGHRLLFLWDYKHGHRECPAFENLQMADYLQGVAELFGIDGAQDQHTQVVVRVVQPFCYTARAPVSEWAPLLSDVRPLWNQLSIKAYEVEHNPTLSTGLWCRDCSAVGTCAATRGARYNFIELVNQPYEMDDMRGPDLAAERAILTDGVAVARARLTAIEDELQHRIANGEADSGLTLETAAGRLNWTVPPAQVLSVAMQFGVDASKDAVLTPAQTLAKASKEVRPLLKQVADTMTERKAGSLKLIPVGDSRTARAFKRKD